MVSPTATFGSLADILEANVLLARLVGEYLHLYTKCIFVYLDFVMDTQRLIELGKEMSLEGEDLRAFVRQEQEAAREERASVRQEAREVEEAAAKQRHEEAAAKQQHEEAAAKQRHEEATAKQQHEKEMLTLQLEADRLRVQEAREASISHAQLDSSRSTRIGGRSPKLPSFCDGKDDMDSYLQRFERYAENEGWDPECFGTYLGSLLSGKALEVYSQLPAADARDYETLKEALLVQYQLTQEDYRKIFFSGVQSATETASQFLARLEHCFDHWVRLSKIEHSFEGLRELVLMEQFLHACPRDLALFAKERSPRDLRHLLELSKVFTSARMAVGSGPQAGIQASRNPTPRPEPRVSPPSEPTPRSTYGNRSPGLCFTCRQPGHRAANCPSGKPLAYFENTAGPPGLPNPVRGNAAVTIAHACSVRDGKVYLRCGCALPIVGGGCIHGYQSIPLMTGRVGNQTVTLLRDTGCDGVVVKRDLVEQRQLTGDFQRLILINRDVLEVPVARISIDTPVYTGEVLALCMLDPICDLVIGNIPGVHPEIMGTSGQPSEGELHAASAGNGTNCAVLTRAQTLKDGEPLKPFHVSGYPALSVTPRDFREAQRKDDDLVRHYEFVNRIEQTCNLAHDHLLPAQRRYKRHFVKKAHLRVLEVGDKVLVMLPTDRNKLLLRWEGPYSIEKKVGLTDYRIKVGTRLRLFHVNMLKKYTEREPMTCATMAFLDCGDCPELDMGYKTPAFPFQNRVYTRNSECRCRLSEPPGRNM